MKQSNDLTLSQKIEKGIVVGGFHIHAIPEVNSASNSNKTFLIFYLFPVSMQAFIEVLSNSGWGGSTLIATLNLPSLISALKAGGVDYLIQGRQYMVPNDLFTDLNSTDKNIAKEGKDKILKFDDAYIESNINFHIMDFTNLHNA